MHEFDVYFRGQVLPDADPDTVRRGIARLFKVQEDAVGRLFSGKPLRVKHHIDADTASKYRAAFRDIGALVEIIPSGAPAPPAITPTQAVAGTADAATPEAAGAVSDGIGLAEPGVILDETPPPPPADIDTSGLDALPPNSGSLEDCRVDKPPRTIPDISHMRLVDD